MLSKHNLRNAGKCSSHKCDLCGELGDGFRGISGCIEMVSDTALQLLERVETAETILRDILSSGNVAACKKEIEAWLGGSS